MTQSLRFLPRRTPLALAIASMFALGAVPTAAQVLPVGPTVVRGVSSITTNGNAMTINTDASRAAINWRTFSIGANNSVVFNQPNAASQVLNRVTTAQNPSQIMGSLQSNGKVWLVNPYGVLFGKSATVDVAGLVTSTLSISDADWQAGRLRLSAPAATATAGSIKGSITNEGQLRTPLGGHVVLVASDSVVNREGGTISAPGGQVLLAAGQSVDLVDTGAPNITMRVTAPQGTVMNLGSVLARGGRIEAQAAIVNQNGLMSADALVATGDGGSIVLRGEQRVQVSPDAVMLARGGDRSGNGGSIETSGGSVEVRAEARVDASATAGSPGRWRISADDISITSSYNDCCMWVSAAALERTLSTGTNVDVFAVGLPSAESGYVDMRSSRIAVAPDVPVSLSLNGSYVQIYNSSIENTKGQALALTLQAPDIWIADSNVLTAGRVRVVADRLALETVEGTTRVASSASGDAIVVSGYSGDGLSSFNAESADVLAATAPDGRWLIYASRLSENTGPLTGLDYDFKQHGASYANRVVSNGNIVTAGSGNGLMFAAVPGTVQLTGTAAKTYDGNEAGSVAGNSLGLASRLFGGDRAIFATVANGTYSSANAGARDFRLNPGAVSFIDGNNRPVYGYTVGTLAGRIDRALLSIGSVSAQDKVYDGTVRATLGGVTFNGLIGDEQLGASALASFSDVNAGAGKAVTGQVTGLTDGANGGFESNYILRGSSFTTTASIDRKPLTLNFTVADKTYDSTRDARITNLTLGGLVGGEQLGLSAQARFVDPNAGIDKAVLGTISLADGVNGGRLSNYSLAGSTSFTTKATIERALLTVSASALDKVYDGTPDARLANLRLEGLVGNEQLGVSAQARFVDANAGSGKTVSGTLTLSDGANALASNYAVLNDGFTSSATIERAPLTITGAQVASRTYNASDAAQVTGVVLSGLVGSEQLGATADARFADANAGVGKAVNGQVTRLLDGANGGQAGNYRLVGSNGFNTTATIESAPLTVNASVADKIYDGSVAAQVTSFSLGGLVGTEQLDVSVDANFADPNAGTGKTVLGSVSLADGANGGRAGNYMLFNDTVSVAANIERAPLTIAAANVAPKVYDGGDAAQVSSVAFSGLVGSEQLGSVATGRFLDVNAGSQNSVAVRVSSLSDGANGGLAANYTLSNPDFSTFGAIRPATLTYVADRASWNLPVITPLGGTVSGFIGSETLATATTGALAFSAAPGATGGPGVYAVAGGGLSARNYEFVQADANSSALNVSAVGGVVAVNPNLSPETSQSAAGLSQGLAGVTIPAVANPNGRALDVTQWLQVDPAQGTSSFISIAVDALSPDSMSSLLSARDRYKQRLFADAIDRLEREPKLADAPDCKTPEQVETGTCLITEALKREVAERRGVTQAAATPPAQQPTTPAPAAAPTPATASPATAQAAQAAQAAAGATLAPDALAALAARRRIKSAVLPQIERKVAVLIGVDEHADRRIPKLVNAGRDARAVGQLLDARLGYETVVLANASKTQIIRTLNQLATTLGPKDSVVLYYAGHGQVVAGSGLGYWQATDADATRPETWLSNTDIAKLVSVLGASQVAVVSDSCYSGSLVSEERIRPSGTAVEPGSLLGRRAAVVMSSGGNEPVFDEGKNGHSPFAFSLMQALQQVPSWQAGGNVFERVRFAVARELPQRPRYGAVPAGGHVAGGDYVFERRELESQ